MRRRESGPRSAPGAPIPARAEGWAGVGVFAPTLRNFGAPALDPRRDRGPVAHVTLAPERPWACAGVGVVANPDPIPRSALARSDRVRENVG